MNEQKIETLKNRIVECEHPETIILFGSYADGTATPASDVDILVVSDSDLPRRQREIELRKRLFGLGMALDMRVLTPDEFNNRLRQGSPFLRQVVSTGKVIYQRG